MKKGIEIIENLGARGYKVRGLNSGKENIISKQQLVSLVGKCEIVNSLEEEEVVLFTADIEAFEEGYDVNVTKYVIEEETSEVKYFEMDEYFKTYKKIAFAERYAKKIVSELN